MTFVCLSSPAWPTDAARSTEIGAAALECAPRIRLECSRGVVWADARGLDAVAIAGQLLERLEFLDVPEVHAGIADTPIAAEVAARTGDERITLVPPGTDRSFLASLDVGVLHPPPPGWLYPLIAAIGIENCGDLARLDPQSVEVRFGAEGVRIWKLARADDTRPIFGPRPRELPSAELEWVDYELSNQEQVVFIVNSLLGTVTDALAVRREGAHAVVLEFSLADRAVVAVPVRCSTPTADRKTWLRVIRAALETVTFEAAVMRIALRVDATAPLADRQGDLFDFGFATARATETALAHLLDKQADAIGIAQRIEHPLPERRLTWRFDPAGQIAERPLPGGSSAHLTPELTIQILPAPLAIEVWTITRRGLSVPDRYYDGTRTYPLATSLGPDRISGGFDDTRFERDYFHGVRDDGVMVLLYRDLASGGWHLAGWWD